MEIKRVGIIGLGALGVLFGHHLSKEMKEEDLLFVADEERISRYKKTGFYSNGEQCQFTYVSPRDVVEPVDLIIFAVKYAGLPDAIQAVKNIVGPNTIMLSALNGIVSEEVIGQTYGMDKVVYSVAQGMDAVKVGPELTYSNMGMLCFGDWDANVKSERTQRVAQFFEKTN